jgi:hypothetical protein
VTALSWCQLHEDEYYISFGSINGYNLSGCNYKEVYRMTTLHLYKSTFIIIQVFIYMGIFIFLRFESHLNSNSRVNRRSATVSLREMSWNLLV